MSDGKSNELLYLRARNNARHKCTLPSDDTLRLLDEIARLTDELRMEEECYEELASDNQQQADEIERLTELTTNDGLEIGSYTEGTGLRGENARLTAENERLQEHVKTLSAEYAGYVEMVDDALGCTDGDDIRAHIRGE